MLTTDKLKSLLGIELADTSRDNILEFIIDDVIENVINYCNIEELPSGLEHTAYRMAIDLYRNENVGNEESAAAVSSIEEGDTTVQFRKSVDEDFKNTLLKNYIPQLNRYRRIAW
ncbi:phage head-tail connector protein [Pectinatus frisingensis]|uniref:phage head-tail connector protein n=1 Tax=Pectinatus frisingensis TaxID=865 RepID=UPI0015F6E7C7|nr:phage head-tail connector protein [Pectinatus frisingensis]